MPAISATTRASVKGYLEGFITGLVESYREWHPPRYGPPTDYLSQTSSKGRLKPFHHAIMPVELLRTAEFERSFSTRLGSTFEECARLIALEHHAEARRGYKTRGLVSQNALNEIDNYVRRIGETTATTPQSFALCEMVDSILAHRRNDDLVDLKVTSDLYIRKHDGSELFFEVKSPMPNKGQCLEVTQRLLRVHLLRGKNRADVCACFAMAYNPFGNKREDYRWGYARQYLPFADGVVIAAEFWDMVGGEGTYEELLGIYREVGIEKAKFVLEVLAIS